MVHREAYHFVRHLSCYRKVFLRSTSQATVCAKIANQRIEIAARENIRLFELLDDADVLRAVHEGT